MRSQRVGPLGELARAVARGERIDGNAPSFDVKSHPPILDGEA
jgi:hypothetical protein